MMGPLSSYTGRNSRETDARCPLSVLKTNRSWIYTCTATATITKAPATRATGQTAPPPTLVPLPQVPETNASHEHLLLPLSRIDPLPQLQTIQWISEGPQVCCNPTASP